jgi:hypothetical protein
MSSLPVAETVCHYHFFAIADGLASKIGLTNVYRHVFAGNEIPHIFPWGSLQKLPSRARIAGQTFEVRAPPAKNRSPKKFRGSE